MSDRSGSTEAFRQAALAVSTAEGEHVFEQLITSLARILGVEFALISVYVEPQRTMLRTLATFYDGRLAKNIEYPVAGTPCEQAIGRAFGYFPKGVARHFPRDGVITRNGIEGYAATTLHDTDGTPIGALTVMSRSEITDAALTEAMLNIFAARVSAEIGRRRSAASYRAVFENAETAIFLHDLDSGAIVDANPRACRTYGYGLEELKRLSVDELSSGIPPYTGEEARRHFDRARAGELVRGEWQRRNKDGSLHWDEVTLKRVEIGGRPHILAATREITERKLAEQALRASEEQYRAIFNASTDSLTLRDAQFRIVDVNAAYERMSGLAREEVLGATELTMELLEVRDWRHEVHDRALAGEAVRVESDAVRRDGKRFRLEVLVLPMQYGGAPHALYVARDITERKLADEALRASEAQYRAIFNATADALALRDAEFRIVDVNAAYEAMTGRRRADAIGQVGLTISDGPGVDRRALHERALAGEPVRIETEGQRPDGTPLVLEVRGVPVTHRGKPHVLYIGRDITARKAAEGALLASEEQYRAIFNATADALVLRDAQFRIVDVNAAYEVMSGKRREEVAGLTDLTLTRNARIVDRRALHEHALAGKPVFFEADGWREDGSPFVLEVRGVPISYRGEPHVLYIGRDVTEAKLAERALRASEEQYRAIFNAAADAFMLRDADYRVVEINPAYEALSGLKREQVIGATHAVLGLADHEAQRMELHRRALNGESLSLELDSQRRDGSRVPMELQIVPMQYRGAPHVLYVARNIAERRAAEEALRAGWEQYRAIFDATTDSHVLRDAEFRIVDVNPAYEAMSGRTRAEVLGRRDVTMSDPEMTARIQALHHRALAGEQVRWEAAARRKSGEAFHIEVRGVPIQHQGQPHVLYIGRDVTETKAAERELRASEEQYRAIFNASFDGMIIRTLEGEIVDVNPALLAMYGYQREELIGQTFGPIISGKRVEGFRQYLAEVAAGRPYRTESRVPRKDGSAVYIEVLGSPVTYRGKPHVLSVVRDISERRTREAERAQLEAQLRQAQKMEAIGQLTGGIAHDFNNILQGILGNLVLAEERQSELADPKLGRYLERARAASQRARDLIQQMLTFSRGRSGERRPVVPGTLLTDATRLLRPTLPATIELSVELADDAPAALLDPVQFEQVLLNLCINARDAMAGTGRLALAARTVEHRGALCASCRQRVDGRFLEIAVRDSGPGIPAEVRERMFDPFYSTKEVGKGSGMGLAMVHGIVHQHGGHVLVDSAPGGGAVFRVLIP
ncbi:MAG TPA: PAS domain S-box protein, partial [Burkholderiales bacterium]|nr:PAS domain S-box protein [Burkholderiales bacterium]